MKMNSFVECMHALKLASKLNANRKRILSKSLRPFSLVPLPFAVPLVCVLSSCARLVRPVLLHACVVINGTYLLGLQRFNETAEETRPVRTKLGVRFLLDAPPGGILRAHSMPHSKPATLARHVRGTLALCNPLRERACGGPRLALR